jgi:diketogulonate reductase-like aldo/keto reductase
VKVTDSTFGEAVPVIDLADGYKIPSLALGVWQIPDGPACRDAVRWALDLGYRHIDTAQGYGNEASVGEALRASGLPRNEVFVTTKFYPGHSDPAAELEASLERLMLDYVDLYLVHWPQGGPTWAWPGMEQAQGLGHARSIGVSNFDTGELAQVMGMAKSRPVVNQIQLSPFNSRPALVEEGGRYQLVHEAYSPLGTGRHLRNPLVQEIASQNGRSPSQVLIRWGLQRNFVVLAKSMHSEHLAENFHALDFKLSDADLVALDALDQSEPGLAQEQKWWRD